MQPKITLLLMQYITAGYKEKTNTEPCFKIICHKMNNIT